jgi:hypothetical protein
MTPEPQTEVVDVTPASAIPPREVRGEWVVVTREQWQQEVKARRRA